MPFPVRTTSGEPLPSAGIDRICVRPGPPVITSRSPSGDQSGHVLVPSEVKRVVVPASRSSTQMSGTRLASAYLKNASLRPSGETRGFAYTPFGAFSSVSLPFRSTRSNVLV